METTRLSATSLLPAGVGIDEALVDVVHDVGGRRVQRGGEVGHEGRREAREEEAEDARRDLPVST